MFGIDDALIGAIGGGLISTAGQLYANRQNLKEQRRVNDTNWQIAALNNATQIDMANSAHRREVADLRAAGLNPILSAGGSGLSTPSLSSTPGHAASIDNPMEGLANSAKTVGKILGEQYQAELKNKQAETKYMRQETRRLERENAVNDLRSKNEFMKLSAENSALHDLTHSQIQDSDGVWHDDFDATKSYIDLVKKGIVSDAKNRSNQNWRNNAGAFGGIVNSAASLLPWRIFRRR